MNPVVTMEGLGRRFGRIVALENLCLELAPGEVLGLLGHNGAGKSTTMKLILGVLAPTTGRVRVLGEDPRGRSANRLRLELGYLPENVSFYDNLTGREVLRYFARLKRVAPRQTANLLERVGLSHAADRRVRTYSKGMRQRLGLAQALLGEPRLLLLDEPTVGLDPMATRDVYDMIDALRAAGSSVILSSHVLPGVERHIDRIAILSRGRLLADGTVESLSEAAGLPFKLHARARQMNGALRHRLDGQVIELNVDTEGGFACRVAPEHKLAVLRTLLDTPEVEDVSLESPNLETLYAHYDRLAREGGPADA